MTRTRFDLPDRGTLEARQRLVLDHFRDEVAQDWDATLSTFPNPHYELVPTLTVHDGGDDVRAYYRDTRVAFPDQHHEIIELRHSHDAVETAKRAMAFLRPFVGEKEKDRPKPFAGDPAAPRTPVSAEEAAAAGFLDDQDNSIGGGTEVLRTDDPLRGETRPEDPV